MSKLIFIFLFSVPAYLTPPFADSSYTQYSWKEFYQLPEVNQQINFSNPDLSLLSACVYYASNEQREKKGKKPFSFSPELKNAAQFHTQEMTINNFISHNNPYKPPYKTVDKRMKKFNCHYKMYGENIACYSTEESTYLEVGRQLVEDWMNSKGHRDNLMNQVFTHLGCGVNIIPWAKQDGSFLIYSTQDFGGMSY